VYRRESVGRRQHGEGAKNWYVRFEWPSVCPEVGVTCHPRWKRVPGRICSFLLAMTGPEAPLCDVPARLYKVTGLQCYIR